MVSLPLHYEAAMVLSGAGDALGYKNGSWKFCHNGKNILKELKSLGGIEALNVKLPGWMVSDDTVMHLATAEALTEKSGKNCDKGELYKTIAEKYKACMRDMGGRAPDMTSCISVQDLKPNISKWKDGCRIAFNKRGEGCEAAMRAMCIGLRYPREEDLPDLLAVSIESGRMTHHHPTGYLGSLAAALFTAYAIQEKPPREWGAGLMSVLPLAKDYIKKQNFYVKENLKTWDYFEDRWGKYLKAKELLDGTKDPKPDKLKGDERDKFYKELSFSGLGGSSGHDAPMIAYDAILQSGKNWKELCKRAMFHGGDSDSTGVIAACCYGAMYGYEGVPEGNYKNLEYHDRLVKQSRLLYELAYGSQHEVGVSGEKEQSTEEGKPIDEGDPVKKDDNQNNTDDNQSNIDHDQVKKTKVNNEHSADQNKKDQSAEEKREEIETNLIPLDEGNSSKNDDVQSKKTKVDTAQVEDRSTKAEVPKGKFSTEQNIENSDKRIKQRLLLLHEPKRIKENVPGEKYEAKKDTAILLLPIPIPYKGASHVRSRHWTANVKNTLFWSKLMTSSTLNAKSTRSNKRSGRSDDRAVQEETGSILLRYKMDHLNRGKAIIINNKDFSNDLKVREGTDKDASDLDKCLSKLGFEVTRFDNLTAGDMKCKLREAAKFDHKNSDCFVLAILSHGEEGYIWGTDTRISINGLMDLFKGTTCPSLAGKPKMFFIQACRGNKLDEGVEIDSSAGVVSPVVPRKSPTMADFLIVNSTVPGYASIRHTGNGSWFIQTLVDVLNKNSQRMDLLHMMTLVNQKVASMISASSSSSLDQKKQMPCVTSTLTKNVYFTDKKIPPK